MISSSARLLYAILRTASGRDGSVAIYARELADKLGCSESTVHRLNAELREHGFVDTRGQGTGKSLRYQLLGLLLAGAAAAVGQSLSICGYSAAPADAGDSPAENNRSESPGLAKTPAPVSPDPSSSDLFKYTQEPGARVFSAADVVLLEKLQEHGVSPDVAGDLVGEFPDRVAAQLVALQFRTHIRNVAGYLVRAIRSNYPIPQRLSAVRDREQQKPLPAKLTAAEEREIDLQAQRATDAILASLPGDLLYRLELLADEHVSRGILSQLPPNTRREIRRAKLVELAKAEIGGVVC